MSNIDKPRMIGPKLAVLTTEEAGRPSLTPLSNSMQICYSTDVGIPVALDGADAALLWDAELANDLKEALLAASSSRLQWVHAAVAGIDSLPLEALAARDIKLTNAAGIYDSAIAEYALAACLGFERRFPQLHDQQRNHEWSWLHGSRLGGKHVLIVGPGHIGQACARLFRALKCDVAALGSRSKPPTELFSSIEPSTEIKVHIAWADHIVITAPLTRDTYHMLNTEVFAACKPTAHVVNVGRGAIIDTAALAHALINGQIAGATLDVLEEEPLDRLSPLWDMPGVVITPHIAGDVDDFEATLISQFIDNVKRWLDGNQLQNIVDLSRGY